MVYFNTCISSSWSPWYVDRGSHNHSNGDVFERNKETSATRRRTTQLYMDLNYRSILGIFTRKNRKAKSVKNRAVLDNTYQSNGSGPKLPVSFCSNWQLDLTTIPNNIIHIGTSHLLLTHFPMALRLGIGSLLCSLVAQTFQHKNQI
jgi:hypothetical protein